MKSIDLKKILRKTNKLDEDYDISNDNNDCSYKEHTDYTILICVHTKSDKEIDK